MVGTTAVLITYLHDDHFDLAALKGLAFVSSKTRFVILAPHIHLLGHQVSGNQNVKVIAGGGMSFGSFYVDPIPAAHTEYEFSEIIIILS